LREHPDGEIFTSLFKGAETTAAILLAEVGDCRARYPHRDALAGDAGQAAVAIESGKRKTASFRGCNKRLRAAFCKLADSTRHWHPWAQARYQAAIARGHDQPRALRTLGRAWCRIVWRCWQDQVPYDPARHRGLQQHITVVIATSTGPVIDHAATERMAAGLAVNAVTPAADRSEVTAGPMTFGAGAPSRAELVSDHALSCLAGLRSGLARTARSGCRQGLAQGSVWCQCR